MFWIIHLKSSDEKVVKEPRETVFGIMRNKSVCLLADVLHGELSYEPVSLS